MRHLDLEPTNDAVFRMMLTRGPDAHEELIGLLTAVLRPKSPITAIVVETPDILPEAIGQKQIVLDIKVRLQDGSWCDVEMQTTRESAPPACDGPRRAHARPTAQPGSVVRVRPSGHRPLLSTRCRPRARMR